MADLDLQDLYNEALVRELISQTNAQNITWSSLGGNQFSATSTVESVTFQYYITKTQIGTVSYKYNLDVKKNGVAYISLQDGPLPNTGRDSDTQELYNIVEIIVLNLDDKVKDALGFIQDVGS